MAIEAGNDKRYNVTFGVLSAIGIICVVMGHNGCGFLSMFGNKLFKEIFIKEGEEAFISVLYLLWVLFNF